MAKVQLDIESDLGPVISVFGQAENLISQTRESVKGFGKDSQNAFKSAGDEAEQYAKDVQKGTKEIKEMDKATQGLVQSGNRIKEIKKEIKELTSQAFTLRQQGDLIGADKAIKEAGKLKDELKDINDIVKAVSGNARENLAGGFAKATQVAAMGFEGVVAAQGAVGVKNEDIEKQLLKLQSIQSLARIAGEFGDIGDRLSEIKLGLSPITNGLKTLYTSGNDGLKKLGKEGIGSIVSGLGSDLKSAITGAGAGIKSFVTSSISGVKTLFTTIAANPFGVVLVTIGAIIGIMIALKDKVKPIAAIFEFLGNVIDGIADSVTSLGEALGVLPDEAEKRAEATIKNAQKETEAIKSRYDFEIQYAEASGKSTEEIEKRKSDAVKQRAGETMKALFLLKATNGKLDDEQLKEFEEAQKEYADAVKENLIAQAKAQTEARKKEEEAKKKADEEAKKAFEKRKQLQKDFDDAVLDLAKRRDQAELNLLQGEDKINKEREIADKEVQLLRETLIKKGQLLDKNFKLTAAQEEQFNILEQAIVQKQNDDLIALAIQRSDALAQQQKKDIDNEAAFLDLKTKLAIAAVNGQKQPNGQSDEAFAKTKERAILKIELDAANESLEIKRTQLEAEANIQRTAEQDTINKLKGRNDTESLLKRDQAQENIRIIDQNLKLQTELLNKETDNWKADTEKKIEQLSKELNPKPIDFKKLFNFDSQEIADLLNVQLNLKVKVSKEDIDSTKAALKQLGDSLKELSDIYFQIQNDRFDQELAQNEERLKVRDQNLSDLQDKLAKEEDLKKRGLANDVDRLKEQIAAEQKAKQDDIENEKRIKAEKKKLALQQLKIDTALQASQMVVAIAQLFANGSSFWVGPVPVGLIVAGIAATAMTAAFVAGKKRAFDAVKSDEPGFYKGGYTGDIGVMEEAGVVHGQEFVHDAPTTKRYRNLFEGIRNEDKSLIEKGVMELLAGTGVTLSGFNPRQIASKRDDLRAGELKLYRNDNSGIEKRLSIITDQVDSLISSNKNKEYYLNDGTKVEKKGSLTRTIKVSK